MRKSYVDARFTLGLAWPADHSTVVAFYRALGPPAVQLPAAPTASLFVVIRAPAEPDKKEGTGIGDACLPS